MNGAIRLPVAVTRKSPKRDEIIAVSAFANAMFVKTSSRPLLSRRCARYAVMHQDSKEAKRIEVARPPRTRPTIRWW